MVQLCKVSDETWKLIVQEGWIPKNRSVDTIISDLVNERNELRKYVAALQQMQNIDKDKMDELMSVLIAIFENGSKG